MSNIEPCGALVVEIGQGAFLQYLSGGFILGRDSRTALKLLKTKALFFALS
jgi:hypothetical protein